MNGEQHIIHNQDEDAQSLFGRQSWNIVKRRGLNIIFLRTVDHYMEFMFCVDMGLACIDKVKVFNINEGPDSAKKFEWYKLSDFATRGEDGSVIDNTHDFTVRYGETSLEDSEKKLLRVAVPKYKLSLETTFSSQHESMYWS